MPALYFKGALVKPVERGAIKQHIRRRRRGCINIGDKLYLYSDNTVRPKRRLRETKCDDVLPIFIDVNRSVVLGCNVLSEVEKFDLAKASGFGGFGEMFGFFQSTGGLPMSGDLITWL